MSRTVLIVDDETKLLHVLSVALEALGYQTLTASTGTAALKTLDVEDVDLVLTDLRMPGITGRELMRAIHERRPGLPVILMTAYATVRDAVDIIKQGASDYIGKPVEMDELESAIASALRLRDALRENQRLREELEGRYRFDNLAGSSAAFRTVITAVAEVCASKANVLITGESGTGKEMVARAIHFNSPRKESRFIAINCAAIPENLLESELFGHVKGAFTGALSNRPGRFATADGGTIFLDEIGDMPLALQAKILRTLQERTIEPVGSDRTRSVDVRVIAATNRDLLEAVRAGRFREDLYYRLSVYPIALPPLRDREDDVAELADRFVARLAAEMGKRVTGITPAARRAMASYPWPGNIRELQNCVERAVIVARGDLIDLPDLPPYLFQPTGAGATGERESRLPADLAAELEATEKRWIIEALRRAGGVQVRAAAMLGITDRGLWHRIRKLDIRVERVPKA
ncbi:sigma-54-dependent Fis family transcriptional regulator [Vineibacter terrae]|uniref:Sigma-54-dependent Fis family transcriptional regulator n=1 Tax=Vineibacter terrae TaxID=2586908 RepID=A0A5C8PDS1_9HYPH|nr:sigma-54 dependent transcriptional regulator [Vineibacter terrae]TXL71920.1 sigma-54-dependent Fis family transcriptional regulator [Vineibacter terrae]